MSLLFFLFTAANQFMGNTPTQPVSPTIIGPILFSSNSNLSLPKEIVHHILHFCSSRDICAFDAACTSFHATVGSETLWKQLCVRDRCDLKLFESVISWIIVYFRGT